MTDRLRKGVALAMVLALAASLPACSRIKGRQGYLVDEALVAAVQPGIDNKESVQGTLGRPSFTGQFDDRDWYYVSRDTRQLSFASPTPVEQTVLHVRFDTTGNVEAVERTGLERVVSIDPISEKTPTLGRDRSFFQELFGNIGSVGAGRNPGTADNPQ